MISRLICISLFLVPLLILSDGCNNKVDTIDPTKQTIDLQFEVVSKSNLPGIIDSILVYTREYKEWNTTSYLDTVHADSLAHYFVNSKYSLSDLWFPNEVSVCGAPMLTNNIVYVKLLQPDTTISQLGFNKAQIGFSPCFLEWRHYTYVRN